MMVTNHWLGGGRFWEPARRLSVLDLVGNGTIDLRLASLLWLLMEYRASVLVAAAPSYAGKTTTLNVLLDFLPPTIEQINLRGEAEDFQFLGNTRPAETYLVAAEFSDHFAYFWGEMGHNPFQLEYVWGDVARRVFQLLPEGYSIGGTIHAGTAKEVVYTLYRDLNLPLSLIAYLDVVITLRVFRSRSYAMELVRQVDSVSLVRPKDKGIILETIAYRESGSGAYIFTSDKRLQAALSTEFAIKNVNVVAEIKKREQFLAQLLSDGIISRNEVRKAVVDFYQSRSS